jgi:hypothetical protein
MKALLIFLFLLLQVTLSQAQNEINRQYIRLPELKNSYNERIASGQLWATNIIEQGAKIRYSAGQAITLQSGFSVQPGAVFQASIRYIDPVLEWNNSTTLVAFPNPFTEKTTIKVSLPLSNQVKHELLDINGRLIQEVRVSRDNSAYQSVATIGASLPAGVYLYRVQTQNQSRIIRLIKQ